MHNEAIFFKLLSRNILMISSPWYFMFIVHNLFPFQVHEFLVFQWVHMFFMQLRFITNVLFFEHSNTWLQERKFVIVGPIIWISFERRHKGLCSTYSTKGLAIQSKVGGPILLPFLSIYQGINLILWTIVCLVSPTVWEGNFPDNKIGNHNEEIFLASLL